MYYDTLKAENKIISYDDLTQIFQLMGETLKKYKKISERETIQNREIDYKNKNYSFKDEGSKIRVIVDFYDNTNITFDNYDDFMNVFYSRVKEIRYLDVHYSLSYMIITPEPNESRNYYTQSIQMHINDHKLDITLNLKSEDPKLNDIYDLIKTKILTSPEKYDEIIRKRKKITNTIAFAIGFIPGIIITTLLLFIPSLNFIFFKGYVVYPLCILFLTYLLGSMIAPSKLDKYYDSIVPNKTSAGYDSNFNRIYKDDIDSFINTSEILIGKKFNNLENRRMIKSEFEKYKSFILKEIITLFISSAIVIIVGFFINL